MLIAKQTTQGNIHMQLAMTPLFLLKAFWQGVRLLVVEQAVVAIAPRPFLKAPLQYNDTSVNSNTAGSRLNIKTVFPRYGDSHVKDKMVARPSYL